MTHFDAYAEELVKDGKPDVDNLFETIMGYIITVVFFCFYVVAMVRVNWLFRKADALMKIASNPLDFVQNHGVQNPMETKLFLNPRVPVVSPPFLRAWSSLREHIQKWELGYFYELSQPIISMEIVFVLIMIVVLLVMVLQDPYNGQVELFLFAMILHSNVLMMLIMMAFLVIVFVFMHLFRLLLVYKEQKMHEKWVQGMIRKFQIEEANMLDRFACGFSAKPLCM